MTRIEAHKSYAAALEGLATADAPAVMRRLALTDLFYLLVNVLGRPDIDRDWLYARCREVEREPDGRLDLWARDHRKSSIITFGKTIQDVLSNPEERVGIFSHTKPIAKKFLNQIMREFEDNARLKTLFPEALWENPRKEAPKWSEDEGIILKRKGNPKEPTIYASGLVDGQPTGMHFTLMIYDDVVTRESVYTAEQIRKTTEAWELSLNLPSEDARLRYIGTRYHAQDTYAVMLDPEREAAIPRIYPATDDGTDAGRPVLLSDQALRKKRRNMGPYTFACQMLLNPFADKAQGFRREWVAYWKPNPVHAEAMTRVLLVDPANGKKKGNDYTVMAVIGLAPDNNYYLLDGIRDRLNLTERTERLFALYLKHRPHTVGYEQYGMQADIEHIRYVQEQKNFRFSITPMGGAMAKRDRILRLAPVFEQGRFFLASGIAFVDYEGRHRDFTQLFVEDEMLTFPVAAHDDMLDCMARVLDPALGLVFPLGGGAAADADYRLPELGYDPFVVGRGYDPFGDCHA